MSPIKTLLLHLDASPRCAVRLEVARQLAQRHEAMVTGLFAVTSNFVEIPFAMAESSAAGEIVLKLDAERRERALSLFAKAMLGEGAAVSWNELSTEPVIWGFTQQALYADLLVLGQRDPESASARDLPADFIESVVLGSGKPALIVPYAGEVGAVGRNVLVAWNTTRESARALSAALPVLQGAQQVHLVAWSEETNAPKASSSERVRIEKYLAAHGIQATLHWYGDGPGNPGERLLSLAADLGNDLLVMGCYGHSRARELVIGGTTRTVLKSMTLPVLMAH